MKSNIIEVAGRAFRLTGDDIDTDRIIPARFLKCVTFEGLGDHVFEDDRNQLNGKHPFDQPENKGRKILIADNNFGCGSSREHAVAALQRWGIKAIVARSFAAIFRGNAVGNGLVCVDVDEQTMSSIIKDLANPHVNEVRVDLESQKVCFEILDPAGEHDNCYPFQIPPANREMLMAGVWDQMATLLQAGDRIEETAACLPYMAKT